MNKKCLGKIVNLKKIFFYVFIVDDFSFTGPGSGEVGAMGNAAVSLCRRLWSQMGSIIWLNSSASHRSLEWGQKEEKPVDFKNRDGK